MDPIGGILPSEATKSHLRSREESETEPGFYLLEDNSLSRPQQVRLRSLISTISSTIVFCNKSEVPSVAVWIDFEGHEVAYSVIEPGASKKYRTYATHPWIMRAAATGERMMLGRSMVLFAEDKEQVTVINMTPTLHWSLSTHKFWPAEFRAVVRLLLLSHARANAESDSMQEDESCDSMEIEPSASLGVDESRLVGNDIEMPLSASQLQRSAITDALFSSFNSGTLDERTVLNHADLLKLPLDVVMVIIFSMVPEVRQRLCEDPAAYPDIQPAFLPSDPATWGPPISAIANEQH